MPVSVTDAIVSPAGGVLHAQVERGSARRRFRRGRRTSRAGRDRCPMFLRMRASVSLAKLSASAEREIVLHPHDCLAGNHPELLAGGQLRRQHFGERRRQPGRLGPLRQILEAEDGNGSAALRGCRRPAVRGRGAAGMRSGTPATPRRPSSARATPRRRIRACCRRRRRGDRAPWPRPRSARTTSSRAANRSAGSRSRQRRIVASQRVETPGRAARRRRQACCSRLNATASGVSPANGSSPVTISYITTPSA